MANLKVDLLNQIGNEKYYEEMEFIRLAQEPNMNYKMKVDQMQMKLANIALLNAEIGLVSQYIQDAPPAPPVVAPTQVKAEEAPVVANAGAQPHPGQTFAE